MPWGDGHRRSRYPIVFTVVVPETGTTTFFSAWEPLKTLEIKNCFYFWTMEPNKKFAMEKKLSWADFMKVEMAVGTIVSAEVFVEARNPSYKLLIDFGSLGQKKSSAQITDLYSPGELLGKQVIAVVNFPPKQIANIMSECLVLGSLDGNGTVTLLQVERPVENGSRIG